MFNSLFKFVFSLDYKISIWIICSSLLSAEHSPCVLEDDDVRWFKLIQVNDRIGFFAAVI